MIKPWLILLIHQVLYQGMFFAKNIHLKKSIGKKIRGHNIEATLSILFFICFIGLALFFAATSRPQGTLPLITPAVSRGMAFFMLLTNLIISGAALLHLKDSWRVGVLEDQKTALVTTGIFAYSRNPYFVSYLLMFFAYALLLGSLILFTLSLLGWLLIHLMILKEEKYLLNVHKDAYRQYTENVPRYLLF